MFSSTTLVCIVDLMCIADHMSLLACNVCGGITAVRSILSLWYLPYHSLWINLWTCMVSELSCHLWEATIVWTPALSVVYICVCWPPKRRVYTITSLLLQHRKYLLLFSACPIYPAKVSHYYRPTSVDKASVHIVKGITKNIRITGGWPKLGDSC